MWLTSSWGVAWQLEADQQTMVSRLEEEEQAREALMGRIQRLTKLILVSSKPPHHLDTHKVHRRRLSFGEEDVSP